MTQSAIDEKALEERLFQRLLMHVDGKICDVVKTHIKPTLQQLVEQEDSVFDVTMLDSPTVSRSSIKQTSDGFDDRIKALEDIIEGQIKTQFNKMETFMETYRIDRKDIMTSFEEITQNLAILKSSIEQNTQLIYATNERVNTCEHLSDQICAAIDNLGQYQRRETLEFHSIPDQGTRTRSEDTNEIVMHFCDFYLGLPVKRSDISVSHRQPIEADRKRIGDRYIAPIYCRFVNRKLAMEVLKRKHLLKNVRSKRGDRFFVNETLTLQRRLLRDRAKKSLTTYKFHWVKNGTIFAKKNENTRPIRECIPKPLSTSLSMSKMVHQLAQSLVLATPSQTRSSFRKLIILQPTMQTRNRLRMMFFEICHLIFRVF